MKQKRPFVWMICLLLVTGCTPRHKPISGVVLIPVPDANQPSVYVQTGGTLTFETEEGTPPDTTLEVQFFKDQQLAAVCSQGETLTGKAPLTCKVTGATGDYDIAIAETYGGKPHIPRHIKAYVRPCKGCLE